MARTRQYRRFKQALKKKKCARYWNAGYWAVSRNLEAIDPAKVGRCATTPKACGCWMCSNARQVFGIPFSDVRRKQRYTGGE